MSPSSPPTRRGRWPLLVGIFVGVIVLLAAAMFIYDHARRDQIAKGVTIAGVPVGGLSEADARVRIERDPAIRNPGRQPPYAYDAPRFAVPLLRSDSLLAKVSPATP